MSGKTSLEEQIEKGGAIKDTVSVLYCKKSVVRRVEQQYRFLLNTCITTTTPHNNNMSTVKFDTPEGSREQTSVEVIATVAMKNIAAAAENNGPVLSSVMFSTGRFIGFNDKPSNFRLMHTVKRDKKVTFTAPFIITSGSAVRDVDGNIDAFVLGGLEGQVAYVVVKTSEEDCEQYAAEIVRQGVIGSGKRVVRVASISFADQVVAALTEDGTTHLFSPKLASATAVLTSTNSGLGAPAGPAAKGCYLNTCPIAGGLIAAPVERDSVDIISVDSKKTILKDAFTPHGDAGTGLAAFLPVTLTDEASVTPEVGLLTASANMQEVRLWQVNVTALGSVCPKLVQTITLPNVGFYAEPKAIDSFFCDTLVKISNKGDVIVVASPSEKHTVVLARQMSGPGMCLVQRITDFKVVGMGGFDCGMILANRVTKEGFTLVGYGRNGMNVSRVDFKSSDIFGTPNVGGTPAAAASKASPKRAASPRTNAAPGGASPLVRVGGVSVPNVTSSNPNVKISSTSMASMVAGTNAGNNNGDVSKAVADALSEQAAIYADSLRGLQASIQELQSTVQGGEVMRKDEAQEKGRRHASLIQRHNNNASAGSDANGEVLTLLLESVPEAMTLSMHRVAAQHIRDVFPKTISKTVEEAVRIQQADIRIPPISASKLPSIDSLDAAIALAHSQQTKMINTECETLVKSLDTSRDNESTQQCLRASKAFMNSLQHAVRDLAATVEDTKRGISGGMISSTSGAAGAASEHISHQHTVNLALGMVQKGEFNAAFDSVLGLDDDIRLLEFVGSSCVLENKEAITAFGTLSIPVFASLAASLAKEIAANLGSAPMKLEWISDLFLNAAELLSDREAALKKLSEREVEDIRMCKQKFRGILEELDEVPDKEVGNPKTLRMAKRTIKRTMDF